LALSLLAVSAHAVGSPYTVAYTDGGNWQTLYVQGFNTSLGANPNPGLANGTPVYLNQFQFFKSGTVDNQTNIRLAILNSIFPNNPTVVNTTTSSPTFVGLSTNTLADTTGIATGQPITFNFDSLPLNYGSDYAAMFVNVGAGGALTPIRVSALAANYAEPVPGSGDFHPVTNYGTESQFNYATSNFINNGFFNTFAYAGDANFSASIETVPEPASVVLAGAGLSLLAFGYRRRMVR
jgi:hypothetical protein